MTYVLAPLAGFTDAPFRRLCHEGGADLTYTEMVSAAALAHGHNPTLHLLETMPGEGPVACQLFGATESDLAIATRKIVEAMNVEQRQGFVSLNLNAGCPMDKVTRCGAGAELVKDPAKIARLLRAMRENTDLPITLKTRLGPHPKSTTIFEIIDAAEQEGCSGIIVHARYTSQMHGGEVHLDTLAEVVSRSHIPVTGNGSVIDRASAERMAATGVAAIMIGRAALAHPTIFSELKSSNPQSPISNPQPPTTSHSSLITNHSSLFTLHLSYLLAFREQLATKFPHDHVPSVDGFISVKMHTHLFRYFNGRPGAAALRARLNQIRTLHEVIDIVKCSIRDKMRALRNAVAPIQRAEVSSRICSQLLARADVTSAIAHGAPIAVYLATPHEIDLSSFIDSALARGAKLCAPRWNGVVYEMAELPTRDPRSLVLNSKFSISEPPPSFPLVPSAQVAVWIVPGLAFTKDGARLGYGGGWYDRLLADVLSDTPVIGVGYDFQVIDDLTMESTDRRVSEIVTANP